MTKDDDRLSAPRPKMAAHVVGQALDDLSAPELGERIAALKAEIVRLEDETRAREATRLAAGALFKR